MSMYKSGAADALVKLGVDRPRALDSSDKGALTSMHSSPQQKTDYYRNYLQDVAGHGMQPQEDYVTDTRKSQGLSGGVIGGLAGAGLGAGHSGTGRGALIGALGGAALGGLAGYGLGGPAGRAAHSEDEASVANAQYLMENDPALQHAFMRESANIDNQRNRQALQEQRGHDARVRTQYLIAADHLMKRNARNNQGY